MLSLIAAIGKNRELGKDGGLIWKISEDMKFFKKTTMGHPIFMGGATFRSLPGILPGREHYVITKHPEKLPDGVHAVSSIDTFVNDWKDSSDEVFVIGGGMVYWEMINKCQKLYLTEIDAEADADVYFPEFDKNLYIREVLGEGEENGVKYQFVLYTKK